MELDKMAINEETIWKYKIKENIVHNTNFSALIHTHSWLIR